MVGWGIFWNIISQITPTASWKSTWAGGYWIIVRWWPTVQSPHWGSLSSASLAQSLFFEQREPTVVQELEICSPWCPSAAVPRHSIGNLLHPAALQLTPSLPQTSSPKTDPWIWLPSSPPNQTISHTHPCKFFFKNWSIIALQCCVSSCCTMKWICYVYTYIPSLMDLPPKPPSHASRTSQSTELGFLWLWSEHELLTAKFRLNVKKVGKTTRPFRYDLNQIPYEYMWKWQID